MASFHTGVLSGRLLASWLAFSGARMARCALGALIGRETCDIRPTFMSENHRLLPLEMLIGPGGDKKGSKDDKVPQNLRDSPNGGGSAPAIGWRRSHPNAGWVDHHTPFSTELKVVACKSLRGIYHSRRTGLVETA